MESSSVTYVVVIIATLFASVLTSFYADNGLDQTIYHPRFSKKEKREMQQEILSLLGLDHRPKPHNHETDTSAPRYMLHLYRYLSLHDPSNAIEQQVNKSANEVQTWTQHDKNPNALRTVDDADIIMSFVNHGKRKRAKNKCRRVQLHLHTNGNTTCKFRRSTNITRTVGGKRHLRHSKDRRFWFDVSEVSVGEVLIGAELRLYKETIDKNHRQADMADVYTITVFEIVQGGEPGDLDYHFLDAVNTTVEYEGWLYFNVSESASKWMIFPETNFGLYIKIQANGEGEELHPRALRIVGVKGREDLQPFMVAFFKTPQELHVRRTRAARQKQRTDRTIRYNDADSPWNPHATYDMERIQKNNCQKRTLYVSFKELGWQDWIIAPDGYAAFYCAGLCSFPLNAHMNATNHAIVQTLVHLMHPYNVPKPCCAPTKLTSISVLYFDDNSNVILKKYRNMVVKSCGCH